MIGRSQTSSGRLRATQGESIEEIRAGRQYWHDIAVQKGLAPPRPAPPGPAHRAEAAAGRAEARAQTQEIARACIRAGQPEAVHAFLAQRLSLADVNAALAAGSPVATANPAAEWRRFCASLTESEIDR